MPDLHATDMAWRALLPHGVHCSVGFEAPCEPIPACRQLALEGAGPRRRREFATGRWHARQALAALGVDAADLPRQADGSPAWPPGVVGSISHTRHEGGIFAVAIVAEAAAFRGLGVDVEAPGRIEPRLWPEIFLPTEIDALMRIAVPLRSVEASLLWSAKEAAAKACGNRIPLAHIEVTHDPARTDFAASSSLEPLCCTGKLAAFEGWTFALAFT